MRDMPDEFPCTIIGHYGVVEGIGNREKSARCILRTAWPEL